MEGLIPYLIHVVRKQKPRHINRTFSRSGSSNRSYHLLLQSDSFSGSSHGRTRSGFQPPTPTSEFLEQSSYGYGFDGFMVSPRHRGPVSAAAAAAAAPTPNAPANTASHAAPPSNYYFNNIRK